MASSLPDYADTNLESPGAAFARQARIEKIVLVTIERCVRRFLPDIAKLAMSEGRGLTISHVWQHWKRALDDSDEAGLLSSEVQAFVEDVLSESDIPEEAFEVAHLIMRTGQVEQWSRETVADQLRVALRVDEGAMTAAGAPREMRSGGRGPRHGTVWAELDLGGMSWMDRMKRDARTAVNGLDGLMTTNAIRQRGYPQKKWVSRHDDRVRFTHAEADGQIQPAEKPFHVGFAQLMYPGDRSGPAEEVINCRCVVVAVGNARMRDEGGRFKAMDRGEGAPQRRKVNVGS